MSPRCHHVSIYSIDTISVSDYKLPPYWNFYTPFWFWLYCYFKAHQHEAAGVKISLNKNNDHDGVSHGVECSHEGDRIPLWRAIDKRWNRNTVSLVPSVTAVMRLLISWISSMADWFQVPGVSAVTCKKMWEAERAPYFTILFAAALFAAEHASLNLPAVKFCPGGIGWNC